MSKLLSYVFFSAFFILAMHLTSACASRGFKLSQQMPGMDNKLNPVFAENAAHKEKKYHVTADGSIVFEEPNKVQNAAKDQKRSVASEKDLRRKALSMYENPRSQIIKSTLDPENGAVLLGEAK